MKIRSVLPNEGSFAKAVKRYDIPTRASSRRRNNLKFDNNEKRYRAIRDRLRAKLACRLSVKMIKENVGN